MLHRTVLNRRVRQVACVSVLLALYPVPSGAKAQYGTEQGYKPEGKALNLFERHKEEYIATDTPAIVTVKPAKYLTVTGKGEPGGEVFRKKTGLLYGVAYGIKMKRQFSGQNYEVCPLEGLWWGTKSKHGLMNEPKTTWNWKLLIRVPEYITDEDLTAAVNQMGGRGGGTDVKEIKLETIREGRCVQMLHVGPYDKEPANIAKMLAFAEKSGLKRNGVHHEIYLSDPNRVAPEKLRTILRQPVK
ncbi:MAG: GyrI-like domain-containing protein [Phycisphaerae bacterium]